MKRIFHISILLFLFAATMFAQGWSEVLSPEINSLANDLVLISDNELWMVADDGLAYHTTDGFDSSEEIQLNTEADLAKVFFLDANKGWIGAEDGTIFITTDGGVNWEESSLASLMPADYSFSYCDGVYFVNDQLGFVLAGKYKYNYLYKTTDGGTTWSIKDSLVDGTSQRWCDLEFYDENKGVVVGNNAGTQRYTVDGGETWAVGDSALISPFSGGAVSWLTENDVIFLAQGNEYYSVPSPVYKSADGGQTWSVLTEGFGGTYDRPKGLYFKDELNGIAVGDNGFSKMFIAKTSDGGNNWTLSLGDYSVGLKALVGNSDLLYALGTSSHILKSEDFGETWTMKAINTPSKFVAAQVLGEKCFLVNEYSDFLVADDIHSGDWEIVSSAGLWNAGAIHFIDENTGIILKENSAILKTTDAGTTWKYVQDPLEFSSRNRVGGISFADDQTGYAWFSELDYAAYTVYKTTDQGETWEAVASIDGPGYLYGGIEAFDENSAFIAGPRYKPDSVYYSWIVYTEDGGTTWTEAQINGMPETYAGLNIYGTAKVDENNAYVVSSSYVYKTEDKGKTWDYCDVNVELNDTSFYRIDFNGLYGIIATSECEILLTEDGGSTWTKYDELYGLYTPYTVAISEEGHAIVASNDGYVFTYSNPTSVEADPSAGIADKFELSQNYPNPFNPTTTINFSVPQSGMVKLSVFNALGQKVEELVNSNYQAGSYIVNFDASALSSGIYFYRLEAGQQLITKKMTLIK